VLAGFLLGLREGLEAALVLGATFSVLRRMRRTDLAGSAWIGSAAAVIVSLTAAAVLFGIGAELEGRAEQVFEAVTMLVAAGMLTWMILWMGAQGQTARLGLEREVEAAASRRQARAVFAVAFLAVAREGVEVALFLSAAAFQDGRAEVALGGLSGIGVACALGWLLYRAALRLNLRAFFQATGWLLLLFAAGLLAHSAHEIVEAGLLPGIVSPLWNTAGVLSETSVVGGLLRSLFGYVADPSLLEVLVYAGYFVAVWLTLRHLRARSPASAAALG
jgi:high-affinity iron transporter